MRATDLADHAGRSVAPESTSEERPITGPAGKPPKKEMPSRDVIEDALRKNEGRVASAARDLGLHRNQLRRWLAANEVDPRTFGAGADAD